MPDVIVKHRPISQSLIEKFREHLPNIVASVLSTDEPDRDLSLADISIEFRSHGDRDWHPSDIGIYVIANTSAKRIASNDENAAAIAERVRGILSPGVLSGFQMFVWIQLIEGGFAFI